MSDDPIYHPITRFGVIPVIAIDSPEDALPLADALLEGGLPVVEITFRTSAAAEAISRIAWQRPELLVGAGTVLSVENLETALACGAKFAVAPGMNPLIVGRARERKLPFVPGVATPSEIEQALSLGCTVLKFFPSEALGGVAMLKALSAPYGHTDVRFVPTGGVSMGNLEAYLALKTVAAVGGTWIAKQEDIAAGRWATIRDRCREAVAAVQRLRGARST